LTDQEGFVHVKMFDRPAERLMGFSTKQLIALQGSDDTAAIKALFGAVDVDTVRTFNILVSMSKFDGSLKQAHFKQKCIRRKLKNESSNTANK
jgi:hypothetical protein